MQFPINSHVDWGRRNRVFGRLDYKAALHELGMEVVSKPGKNGWARLKVDADDLRPSGSYKVDTGSIYNHRDGWSGSLFDLRVLRGKASDVTEAYAYYAGMVGEDIRKPPGPSQVDRRVTHHYLYADEHGKMLAVKCRTADKRFHFGPSWPDGRRVLYRLPELLDAHPSETVHICEGEKDADRLAGMGEVATTLFSSSGPWIEDYAKALQGRVVAIHEDNDPKGRKYAAMVAMGLWGHAKTIQVVRYDDLPENGDVSDWLDQGHDRYDLISRVLQAPLWRPKPTQDTPDGGTEATDDTNGPAILWADQVVEREIEWIWPNRAPRRKVWGIAGPGGLGKSFLLCDLAARVTTGAKLPFANGQHAPKGLVLYVTGEDDPDDTLVPRLRKQSANLSMVAFLTPKELVHFNLANFPASANRLVAQMKERHADQKVQLVVIDPPSSFLEGIDENSNAEVRGVLTPVKLWAETNDCSVVLNTHVNKGAGKNLDVQMRVMGSVAWTNAPRIANIVLRDPNDPDVRLFIPLKTNIGGKTKALSFRIVPDPQEMTRAKLEWIAEVDIDAQTAMEPPDTREPKTKDLVETWLIVMFRKQSEYPTAFLEGKLAESLGVTTKEIGDAFDRARQKLGIKSKRDGKNWKSYVEPNWKFFETPCD